MEKINIKNIHKIDFLLKHCLKNKSNSFVYIKIKLNQMKYVKLNNTVFGTYKFL